MRLERRRVAVHLPDDDRRLVVEIVEQLERDRAGGGADVEGIDAEFRTHLVWMRPEGHAREHGERAAHALFAPVMMATASVIECDCGVIVAARRPRRWIWMRSATSNTCGML